MEYTILPDQEKDTPREYEEDFYKIFPHLKPVKGESEERMDLDRELKLLADKCIEREEEVVEEEEEEEYIPNFLMGDIPVRVYDHYPMSAEHLKKFLPEGFPTFFAKETQEIQDTSLYARADFIRLVEKLEDQLRHCFTGDYSQSTVLSGIHGVGTSTLLAQLVIWARMNNWISVYLPDPFYTTGVGFLQPSPTHPDMYDQPWLAKWILEKVGEAHEDKLKNLKRKLASPLSLREHLNGETLYDYITLKDNDALSCTAYFALVKEFAAMTEYPVLFAVDGLNILMSNSAYGDPAKLMSPSKSLLPSPKLSIVNQLLDKDKLNLMNGVVYYSTQTDQKKEALSKIDPSLIRKIAPFCFGEFVDRWLHYHEIGWLDGKPNINVLKYIFMYTNGQGAEMYKYSRFS